MTVAYRTQDYSPPPTPEGEYKIWLWSNKLQVWHPKEAYSVLINAQNNADWYARTYKTKAEVRTRDSHS